MVPGVVGGTEVVRPLVVWGVVVLPVVVPCEVVGPGGAVVGPPVVGGVLGTFVVVPRDVVVPGVVVTGGGQSEATKS